MIGNTELHQLAEKGHTDAQYLLGVHYCMRNNRNLAQYWLTYAAHRGHSFATELLCELKKRNLNNDY
jgi:TPR repeat protein